MTSALNSVGVPIVSRTITTNAAFADVIIIEDDPYYFLQMPPYAPKEARSTRVLPSDTDGDDYLGSLVPSYLRRAKLRIAALESTDHPSRFDRQGRVIRLDTFSKVRTRG
jgi:aromatic amino acid aminotransferase I